MLAVMLPQWLLLGSWWKLEGILWVVGRMAPAQGCLCQIQKVVHSTEQALRVHQQNLARLPLCVGQRLPGLGHEATRECRVACCSGPAGRRRLSRLGRAQAGSVGLRLCCVRHGRVLCRLNSLALPGHCVALTSQLGLPRSSLAPEATQLFLHLHSQHGKLVQFGS